MGEGLGKRIAVNSSEVLVIGEEYSIKRYVNKKWRNMPGTAIDIGTSSEDGDIFIISESLKLY